MIQSFSIFLAVVASLPFRTECAICDECVNYNNNVCTGLGSCPGRYCVYLSKLGPNGQTILKKSCASTDVVVFDDGTSISNLVNQCVVKQTNTNTYTVKVCTTNYCNRVCENPQPLPATTTCYQCSSFDGSDCTSGTCQAPFCVFVMERVAGQPPILKKDCSQAPSMHFPDGTVLTQLDVCDTRSVGNSMYTSMICSRNYCNNVCGGQPPGPPEPPGPPQRQPITCMACEANNAYDCRGPQCQGNYCVYARTTPSTGVAHVKRSCSLDNYYAYPDSTRSTTLNGCEYRLISGIRYAVNICNSGDFCNAEGCNSGYSSGFSLFLFSFPLFASLILSFP